MADGRDSPTRGRAIWWLVFAIAIGAVAALVGASAGVAPLWVAIAAGVLAAVLPPNLDRRLHRRSPAERRGS